MRAPLFSQALPALLLLCCLSARGAPVAVRHSQGLIHGFLVLRDLDNKIIGSGDLLQVASGSRVTAELTFNFRDGSLHSETAVFSQHRTFQLLTYHLIQQGPSFPQPADFSLNVAKGTAVVHGRDSGGKPGSRVEPLKMPDDLANGFLTTLILNVDPAQPKTTVSMVVPTPKLRVVKLVITPEGERSFQLTGVARKALEYDIKIDIGGLAGLIAPLLGKQPPDIHIWIIPGKAPGFLKITGALFVGGPVWQAELASPVWSEKSE